MMQNTFHVGQLVRLSRFSSAAADHRIYCVVCLVAEDRGERLYRIKNTIGVERLVNANELEPAAETALP